MNSKLTLNLDKSANALRLALDKAGVVANVKAETAAIIDVSDPGAPWPISWA